MELWLFHCPLEDCIARIKEIEMKGSDFFLMASLILIAPHIHQKDARNMCILCIVISIVFLVIE